MSIKGGVSQQHYLSVLGLTGTTDITIGTTPLVMGNVATTSASWETTLTSGPEFSADGTTGLLTLPAGTYIINIFFTMRTLTDERFVQLTFWDDTTELLESLTAMPYLDSSSSYGNASISTIMTLSGSDKYQIKLDNGSGGTALVYLSNGIPPNCGASFYKIA